MKVDKLIKLNVSIGRFFEGYTTYEINLITGQCIKSYWRGSEDKNIQTLILSLEQLRHLTKKLQLIAPLTWHSNYINPDYYEGTKWSVELYTSSYIKKYGVNQFPQTWDVLCETLELIFNS